MGKRYTIGVLVGNAHTSHPRGLIKGICDRVQGENVKVVFFLGTQTNIFYREMIREDYDYQYNTIYDYAMLGQVDVLIIAYGTLCIFREDSNLQEFLARFGDIPYVLLEDLVPEGEQGVHIIADNYGGMRMCLEHLLKEHQYRKICYLSGPKGNRDAMERLRAYQDTMEEYGITVEERMIRYGNFSENVEEQARELLDGNPGVEAIVSANDEMTVGIYNVLKQRGLEVGKDIAVTGFDNTDMSRFAIPTLTTVTQDSYRMGAKAIDLALDICRGREVCSERIAGSFIRRESCGCCRKGMQSEGSSIEQGIELNLRNTVMDLQEFQRKSWMVPFIMRDLMMEAENEKLFFARAAQTFHSIGAKNLYIYMLEKPLIHHRGGNWSCPDKLFLAAQCIDGKVISYEKKERPVAIRRGLWKEHKKRADTGKESSVNIFMNFLLYEGVRQYGVLSVEIEPEAISYFFVLALLFGTALRFFEMGQKEHMARAKLKEKNKVLNFVASYDELTDIYNRRGLAEKLVRFNEQYAGRTAHMLIGDLDHLKQINDNYGHMEGDCAIRTAAEILKDVLKGKGVLGRFGGDEFVAVFLVEHDSKKETYVEAVREHCEEYNRNAGKPYYLNISIGAIDFVCGEHVDIKEMLQHADEFLYQEKKKRRKSVKKEDN